MARHSRDIVNLFAGPPIQDTQAANVSVVVTNDTTLHALGQSWPLPYAVHADIISAILADKPRLLVIDVLFIDALRRDSTLNELADAIAHAGDTRVVIATAPKRYGNAIDILPSLAPAALRARGATVASGAAAVTPESGDHSPYALRGEGGASLALAAFAEWCAIELGNPVAGRLCAGLPRGLDFTSDMEISWPIGSRPGDATANILGGCFSPPMGFWSRVFAAIRDGFSTNQLLQDCPPYETVLAQYLLRPTGREEILSNAITGKAVFYGTSVVGSADAVEVPHMRDPLPGVFVHAAAFENLLRYGKAYLTDNTRPGLPGENWIEFAFSVFVTAVIFFVAAHAQSTDPSRPWRRMRIAALTFATALALLGLGLALLWIELVVLRVAPSNWIALLTVAVAAVAVLEAAAEPARDVKENGQ